jgi:hypothetical protein
MRYAVYFCPAEGSGLHAFGRDWLATETIPGIAPERLRELLINVRRYGWHATLTAPFALATNASYDDLHQKLIPIAQHVEPFELPLALDTLGGFLALRPSGDQTAINNLAERCVRELNPLRAPLTDAEEQALREWLTEHGADHWSAHIDALTICREPAAGQPYEPIARIALGQRA